MANFCQNCGAKLNENQVICVKCGAAVKEVKYDESINQKTNSLAVAGFITAMISLLLNFWGIVGIIATILSGVALSQLGSRPEEKGKALAIIGLCVGIISVIYGVISIFAIIELL